MRHKSIEIRYSPAEISSGPVSSSGHCQRDAGAKASHEAYEIFGEDDKIVMLERTLYLFKMHTDLGLQRLVKHFLIGSSSRCPKLCMPHIAWRIAHGGREGQSKVIDCHHFGP